MQTLAARIAWILTNRTDPKTGGPWTAKALSQAAGLKSAAHIGMIKRGTAKHVRTETIEAIAHAAHVSHRWLATGQGRPDADDDTTSSDSSALRTPRFGNLANWPALRATAKAVDPGLVDWALDEIEHSYPLATAPITPHQVAKMARIAMELLPPPAAAGSRPATTKATKKA